MSIASLKTVPEDLKTSVIKVYSYQDKNLQGILYNPFYGEGVAFYNLTQLLLLMEDMMDDMKFPQEAVRSRRFKHHKKYSEPVRILPRPAQEAIATFKVRVLFRQSASWQGMLTWGEGKQELAFRSALELVKLMDSALPQPPDCDQDAFICEATSVG